MHASGTIADLFLKTDSTNAAADKEKGPGAEKKQLKAEMQKLQARMQELGAKRRKLEAEQRQPVTQKQGMVADRNLEADKELITDRKLEADNKKTEVAKKTQEADKKELKADKMKPATEQKKLDNIEAQQILQEASAKVEVFNYAARFGVATQHDLQYVEEKLAQDSGGFYEHTIDLPEQNIHVVGRHMVSKGAEVAACLKFKQAAEEYQKKLASSGTVFEEKRALSTHNVFEFFKLYSNLKKRGKIDSNTQKISLGPGKPRFVLYQVTIDGQPVGNSVVDENPRRAEVLARLSAAVSLTNQQPDLLSSFFEQLRAGAGTIARALSHIDMRVHAKAPRKIREALSQAESPSNPNIVQKEIDLTEAVAPTISRGRRFMQFEPEAASTRSAVLKARQRQYRESNALADMRKLRDQLPMSQYKDQVIDMVGNNQYSIIIGETGSGKTTQVPQILLDDLIERGDGAACNVVCTQPRRIAAKSVAQRVAIERNENLRETVGYHVRFDAQTPNLAGSIMYCTTGILLKQLQVAPDEVLDSISHVVLDEVHERDTTLDFLLVVLKKSLAARVAAGKTAPKVVIMSATIEPSLFKEYFENTREDGVIERCPSLFVPGRTFPVIEKHLDEIITDLNNSYPGNQLRPYLGSKDIIKYLKAEKDLQNAPSSHTGENQAETAIRWETTPTPGLDLGIAHAEQDALVPCELVALSIAHISRTSDEGAILAFLPGLEEIIKVKDILLSGLLGVDFPNSAKFKIIMLHSSLKEEQDKLFEPLPDGCRKVIISTNVAETSITIPEVRYVVDTGKVAEQQYDVLRRITKLQRTWISKSSSKQRAGRAGRVENGNYWALFTGARFDSFRQFAVPEMHRTDLQGLVLDIYGHSFDTPTREFLAAAIEPPSAAAVETAIEQLKDTEALTDDEELTPLGRVLASLPVHPSLGKMIILGIVFRCLDPMLILGAAANERSMFLSPLDKKQEAKTIRKFCSAGTNSDHIALINAFSEARRVKEQEGEYAFKDFCRRYFIHVGAFTAIDSISRQIEGLLTESGLIPYCPPRDRYRCKLGHPVLNAFSTSPALISGLITAGFHPNVAVSYKPSKMRTATQDQVVPSNHSIVSLKQEAKDIGKESKDHMRREYGAVYAYSRMIAAQAGHRYFMLEVSPSSPLCAVLFGKTVECHGPQLDVDGWIPLTPIIEPSTVEKDIPISPDVNLSHEQRQLVVNDLYRAQPTPRELARLIYTFQRELERQLAGAFEELANVRAVKMRGSSYGEVDREEMEEAAKGKKYLHDDPIRELFARSVKELLEDEMAMSATMKKAAAGNAND